MKKKLQITCAAIITLHLQLITHNSLSQNVGINTDGSTPESNTMLDIISAGTTSTTYGLKVKDATGADKFVVGSNGNVGVGVTSPLDKIHVNGSAGLRLDRDDGGTWQSTWQLLPISTWGQRKLSIAGSADGGSFSRIMIINRPIEAVAIGYPGDFNFPSSLQRGLAVNGNLGVGVTNPTEKLEVAGYGKFTAASARIFLNNTGVAADNRIWQLKTSADQTFRITALNDAETNGSDAIHIIRSGISITSVNLVPSGGNVGVGITNPTQALHVSGNGLFTGTVTASCGVLSCSDIRYKKNILPLANSLEKIKQLQGVQYNWKKEDFPDKNFNGRQQIGIIAQELEKIYPDLVHTDEQGFKTVDYAHLTPVLIEAIKEQQQIIEDQKKVNETQKVEIETLKTNASASKERIGQYEEKMDHLNSRVRLMEEYLKTTGN